MLRAISRMFQLCALLSTAVSVVLATVYPWSLVLGAPLVAMMWTGAYLFDRMVDERDAATARTHADRGPAQVIRLYPRRGQVLERAADELRALGRCPHGRIAAEHCATCTGNEDHYP